jgi:hypothetical protein
MSVALTGLRAENPLAFLAALGCLSLLQEGSNARPRLAWEESNGTWLPKFSGAGLDTPQEVVGAIVVAHEKRDLATELGWEKDVMKVTRDQLRLLFEDRLPHSEAARLLAACVAELPLRRDRTSIHYTPFRTMPRTGRARFLNTALRESQKGIDHIESCLFKEWIYMPDTQSMCWDPGARVPSRALMAEAPTHAKTSGVPGAILLAIRGLASFPLVTQSRTARPPGMIDGERFVWPIWSESLELPLIRMLLSMRQLYELNDERHGPSRTNIEAQLSAHGVIATFSALRVKRGKDDEAFGWGSPTRIGAAEVL